MRLTSSIQSLFRKLEWDFTFSGRCVGDDRLDLVELLADLAFGYFHIVTVLEIHPELCGSPANKGGRPLNNLDVSFADL